MIAPRPPPSDPQPIGRGARLLSQLRRRSRRWLSDTAGLPIGAVERKQWADAVRTLADLLDRFQEWRDNLPSSLANSATAEALDAVLELRGYVEELQAVELPKGFGRD